MEVMISFLMCHKILKKNAGDIFFEKEIRRLKFKIIWLLIRMKCMLSVLRKRYGGTWEKHH